MLTVVIKIKVNHHEMAKGKHRDQVLTYHVTRNAGKRGQLQKQKLCIKSLEAISIDDLIKNMNIE